MSKKSDLSKVNWLQLLGLAITIAGFVLGGGFIYNEVWKRKVLIYTVLPTYDVGSQSFSGLVIENRGRVPLTDVQINLSDLEVPIESLNMPGPREPAQVISGGEGQTELFIEMPRLSSEAPPLSIYILTSDTLALEEGKTFFVSSKEVAGTPGEKESMSIESIFVLCMVGVTAIVLLLQIRSAFRTVFEEGLEKTRGSLIITSAKYGAEDHYNDVTDRVKSAILAGKAKVRVDNDIFGPDPIEKVGKAIRVDYVYAGREGYSKTVPENADLIFSTLK